jgi:hypothetical protein
MGISFHYTDLAITLHVPYGFEDAFRANYIWRI